MLNPKDRKVKSIPDLNIYSFLKVKSFWEIDGKKIYSPFSCLSMEEWIRDEVSKVLPEQTKFLLEFIKTQFELDYTVYRLVDKLNRLENLNE